MNYKEAMWGYAHVQLMERELRNLNEWEAVYFVDAMLGMIV